MEDIYKLPTITLVEAINLIKTPATYLIDTFFSKKLPTANTEYISIEYKKGKRNLAPYIVEGARAINVERESSDGKMYTAPMLGVRRIITPKDIRRRMFGEQPIFTTLSPQDRANKIIADDLQELQNRIQNKKNYMAAELLQTGKIVVEGYADDGRTIRADTIDFNFGGISTVTASWANSNTDIYKDIYNAVNKIAEEVGELPDIMVVGKNVEQYLLNNKSIEKWLMMPNAQYTNFANFAPKYIAPQARYIGRINALGLEVYSYLETYYDEKTAKVKPYLEENTCVIGIGGRGKQITGAITLLEGGSWNTYAAEFVPHYTYSDKDNESSLAVYSRFVPVPEVVESWQTLHTVP